VGEDEEKREGKGYASKNVREEREIDFLLSKKI